MFLTAFSGHLHTYFSEFTYESTKILENYFFNKKFVRKELRSKLFQYFADIPENLHKGDIKSLQNHWNKCVYVAGDYIEYKNSFHSFFDL